MNAIRESFERELGSHWQRRVVGEGSLEATASTFRFLLTDASSDRYSDAQIDDYQGLPRRRFLWCPPLRLTVRARFSDPVGRLRGTAGFGFWNDPFLMTGARLPTLPRAVWFFYASPHSDMKLDLQTAGHGWKAAAIDALHARVLTWAPVAPPLMLLMNLRPVYYGLWPRIQRTLKVREASIAVDMTQWHTYVLEWGIQRSRFRIAGDRDPRPTILDAPSPKGPLGFVMWLDNQYLVATPWGKLRWGLLDVPDSQWMEADSLAIEPLEAASGLGNQVQPPVSTSPGQEVQDQH